MKIRILVPISTLFFLALSTGVFSQNGAGDFGFDMSDVRMHLLFLSSDELRGRKTGELGNQVAAKYISEQFRRIGLQTADSLGSYYQDIDFKKVKPPLDGTFQTDIGTYKVGEDIIVLDDYASESENQLVFANYAWQGDPKVNLSDLEVEGKWVLAHLGTPEDQDVQNALFNYSREKRKIVKDAGAKGLIEIYQGRFPWQFLARFLTREQLSIADAGEDESEFLYALIDGSTHEELQTIEAAMKSDAKLIHSGRSEVKLSSSNIVGILPGTDARLRDEYIVLSAHYDHVGAEVQQGNPRTLQDSIFNGARDNAFGVTAMLTTAQSLAKRPLRRSVVFVAFTAEEDGLLGSEYFVKHPVVPLDKIIFNLNTDGAGYNDTSIVSVFGLERLGIEEQIREACSSVGLGVFGDPAPEQNLFDRSDNVSFAKVGIPAPTISPGFKEFDEAIMEHYHQPSDEAATLDFDYLLRFSRAYSLIARSIGNSAKRPRWTPGDKYESAFKELYGDLPEVIEEEIPKKKGKKKKKKKKKSTT